MNEYLRLRARSLSAKTRFIKVERALELVGIDDRQADVDLKEAQAVKTVMESLVDVPRACIRIGALLILKYPGADGTVVLSRTLSQPEVRALEWYPEIQRKPEQALELLATAITSKEHDDASALQSNVD